MTQFRDPVTGTPVSDREPLAWDQIPPGDDVRGMADALYQWLDKLGRGEDGLAPAVPIVAHASDSYVTDHVLLTSAISFCLACGREGVAKDSIGDLHILRLAALAHELSPECRDQIIEHLPPEQAAFLKEAWQMLTHLGHQLENALKSEDSLSALANVKPDMDDPRLEVLWYAHLAASSRLHNQTWEDPQAPGDDWRRIASLKSRADFDVHPLKDAGQVALVYGGATKIKGYVFESARLPEVRGASSLFDRLNILDVPALWGRNPRPDDYRDAPAYQSALKRCKAVGERFTAISAPECILYASGGNILAFAPVSMATELARAIEQLYTEETLIGNSVSVVASFDLVELQYGRRPREYWLDEFAGHAQSPEHQPLLESYYGGTKGADFIAHKGFGELVTLLIGRANRRRAGGGDEDRDRPQRAIPHYELFPQTIKCHSCDVRPALVAIDQAEIPANQSPKAFCEPCARKRVTGQVAKRDDKRASEWFRNWFDWYPDGVSSWEGLFESFLDQHPDLFNHYFADVRAREKDPQKVEAQGAQDVQEIGAAASPDGYVGYIYADGNDIGALIARIRTPGAYRQFAQRLYQVSQAAVFTALGRHLTARWQDESPSPDRTGRDKIWIHPFEIITIGGDDLIIIVPGDQALEIAATIARELEQRLSGPRPDKAPTPDEMHRRERYVSFDAEPPTLWTEDQWPAISLSAGVAIARDHTPVPYVSELAEQLLKSAKKARKIGPHAGYAGGTVDFAALKTTGMVSLPWSTYLQRAFNTEGNLCLTARPFTWHELRGLLKTVKVLKVARFPRSQIYRLQEDLMALNRIAASVNYLYFLSHLAPDLRPLVVTEFQYAWHSSIDVPPWRTVESDAKNGASKFETIWRDLVEIYDFVPQPDEAQRGKDGA